MYASDDVGSLFAEPSSVHVVGHQWYWDYFLQEGLSRSLVSLEIVNETGSELSLEFKESLNKAMQPGRLPFNFLFSSHMLPDSGPFRHHLLDVDLPLMLEADLYYDFHVSAADVLHSFAVPSLGLKIDAVPGKGNHVYSEVPSGVFFGQCSEICGVNHTNMPIVIVGHSVKAPVVVEKVVITQEECKHCEHGKWVKVDSRLGKRFGHHLPSKVFGKVGL